MSDDDKDDDDLQIMILPEVQKQIDADPKLARAIADFKAAWHQARDAVKRGQHKTMDEALEAITGNRPQKIDLMGNVIQGASLSRDMGLDDVDPDFAPDELFIATYMSHTRCPDPDCKALHVLLKDENKVIRAVGSLGRDDIAKLIERLQKIQADIAREIAEEMPTQGNA